MCFHLVYVHVFSSDKKNIQCAFLEFMHLAVSILLFYAIFQNVHTNRFYCSYFQNDDLEFTGDHKPSSPNRALSILNRWADLNTISHMPFLGKSNHHSPLRRFLAALSLTEIVPSPLGKGCYSRGQTNSTQSNTRDVHCTYVQ